MADGLLDPEGGFTFGGKLFICDSGNHRVLIWNTIPTTNGTPADLVVGQSSPNDFTARNDDNQDSTPDAGPTARTLYKPTSVWTDGTKLIISDPGNRRILIWNTIPTTNFAPADVVIGQSDFTSSGASLSQTGLNGSDFITVHNGQIFAADYSYHRVMIWNSIPTTNGAAADAVLGQPDFVTGTSGTSATTLKNPSGVAVYLDKVVVTDYNNHRFAIFTAN